MNQTDDRRRDVKAKIDRLRKRVKALGLDHIEMKSVMLGVLDLLEDEL